MKRLLLLPSLLLVIAACGGTGAPDATPTTTAPAPTAVDTPTQPTPTQAGESPDGATLPPDPNAGACRLLTPDEVAAVVGETTTVTSVTATDCTYSGGIGIPSLTVRFDSGETLEAARMLLDEPEDITVGGNPAVFGEFMGHLLYVQEGDRVLVFQAIWGEEDRATARTKLTSLAETALQRFPLP